MKRHPLPALALSLLLAGCGSGQFSNPFSATLSVTATPGTVAATSAAPGRTSLTATDGTKPVTSLTVSASSVPDGLKVTVAGASVAVTPSASTPAGAYPVTLHASVPGGSGDVILTVNVTAPADPSYSVMVTPAAASTTPGVSVHVAATVTRDAGFARAVNVLRVDGSAPNIAVTSDTTGATLTPGANAALGQYTFTLVTSDGETEKSTPFTLTVAAR